MTDNEIIKNFEKLTKYSGFTKKVEKLLCDVIDLINRQKSENEELQRKILSCNTKIEVLQEVKEQLEKDVFNAQMNLDSIVYEYELLKQEKTVVQSEAIKEFAKMIINKSRERIIYASDIPDYVKEMTEVNENDRA